MVKRTWCLWVLAITALVMLVGCGSNTTEADIKKLEMLEDRIESLEKEAYYVHQCVYVEEAYHWEHAHAYASQRVTVPPHGGCEHNDNYEDISPFRKK